MGLKDMVPVASLRPRFSPPAQEKGPPDLKQGARLETAIAMRPTTDEAKLNKLETAWLEVLRSRGYVWLGIQNITLKLGDDCRYTPDLWALVDGRLVAFETKGHMEDDALVKLKTAARSFPWLSIVVVKREKGGQWTEQEVKP